MTNGKTVKPLKQGRAGGTYAQADISPAAQKSRFQTTREGEPAPTPAAPPSPPRSEPGEAP